MILVPGAAACRCESTGCSFRARIAINISTKTEIRKLQFCIAMYVILLSKDDDLRVGRTCSNWRDGREINAAAGYQILLHLMGSTLDNDQHQLMGGWNYCSAFLVSESHEIQNDNVHISIPPPARAFRDASSTQESNDRLC